MEEQYYIYWNSVNRTKKLTKKEVLDGKKITGYINYLGNTFIPAAGPQKGMHCINLRNEKTILKLYYYLKDLKVS